MPRFETAFLVFANDFFELKHTFLQDERNIDSNIPGTHCSKFNRAQSPISGSKSVISFVLTHRRKRNPIELLASQLVSLSCGTRGIVVT